VSLDGEDLPDSWVAGQEQVFWPGKRLPVFTQPVPNPLVAPGTKMLLRNAGGRPLVLYRLRLDFSKDAGFIPGDPIGGRGSCSAAQD
jgi:hypothetical protein